MNAEEQPINPIQTFITILASSWMAILLLSLLTILCILGTLIPQVGGFSHGEIMNWQKHNPTLTSILLPLDFFRIFSSKIFFIPLILFFANLLLCTIKSCIKKWDFFFSPLTIEGSKAWGFLIIHSSLLLLALSIFIDQGYRSEGAFLVKEQMWFKGERELYKGGHFYYGSLIKSQNSGPPNLDFSLHFGKLEAVYQGRIERKRSFFVKVKDKKGKIRKAVIRPNQPLVQGGYTITMGIPYGFAPHIIVKEGKKVISSLPGILPPLESKTPILFKAFSLPEGLRLTVELFPNAVKFDPQTKKVQNESYALKQPLFIFTLRQGKKNLGQKILHYKLGTKEPQFVSFGKYQIGIGKIEYWCSFLITKNPGLFWIYFSLWLGLFGFCLASIKILWE